MKIQSKFIVLKLFEDLYGINVGKYILRLYKVLFHNKIYEASVPYKYDQEKNKSPQAMLEV
jgi:hypothetical protein